MNTSTKLPRVLAATIFAALTCSIATVSLASDGDPLQVKVKYADLNVSSESGAATLYARIRTAADTVCRPFESSDLAQRRLLAACVSKAISNAVSQVDQPALSTIYNAKSGTTKPIMLASGQAH